MAGGRGRFRLIPELRLTNSWLAECGIDAGDFVLVESPRYGALVITLHRRARPEDPVGYSLRKPLPPLES